MHLAKYNRPVGFSVRRLLRLNVKRRAQTGCADARQVAAGIPSFIYFNYIHSTHRVINDGTRNREATLRDGDYLNKAPLPFLHHTHDEKAETYREVFDKRRDDAICPCR